QLVDVERLDQVAVGPQAQRLDAHLAVVDAGDHEHGDVGVAVADGGEQLHARHARHVDVGDHQVDGGVARQLLERALGVGRRAADVALELQAALDELPYVGL